MRTVTTRTITGHVNSAGAPILGAGFTSRKAATGNYVLTFPGQRLVGLTASPDGGTGAMNAWVQLGTDGYQLLSWGVSGGAAADQAFVFTATVTA